MGKPITLANEVKVEVDEFSNEFISRSEKIEELQHCILQLLESNEVNMPYGCKRKLCLAYGTLEEALKFYFEE